MPTQGRVHDVEEVLMANGGWVKHDTSVSLLSCLCVLVCTVSCLNERGVGVRGRCFSFALQVCFCGGVVV